MGTRVLTAQIKRLLKPARLPPQHSPWVAMAHGKGLGVRTSQVLLQVVVD